MNAPEIARHLRGRKSGNSWLACCPAHDDRNPSLGLRDADGTVLVHCYAGCKQAAVIAALVARGLWPAKESGQRRRIVAEYNYTDETGQILYQVVRTEPKGFFHRRPDGHGGWINRKSCRKVLYRLREVLESPIIFVCEGEKDVEALRENGFVATTNAGGADAPWLPAYTEALRGREVILLPDSDRPGLERVARIARALIGNVSRLTILKLEGAKDITEWFQQGHSECELIARLEDSEVSR
jgi:DNA primase